MSGGAADSPDGDKPYTGNVFLVGLPGSGKTTVGRRLAAELKLGFVDSDHEIVERTGAAIPLIFEIEGESGFRRREKAVIDDLTQGMGIVLATGGGVVLDPDNRACLRSRGCTIYLRATVDSLVHRTAGDRNRPLLQTDDPRARLELLFAQRDPLYRGVADIVLDTGPRGPAATTRILAKLLQRARP